VSVPDRRTDEELLAATGREPEAFGVFYRRHVRAVLGYVLSRTRRPELAADLAAEVFASALEQRERFDARRGPARAWLLTMTASKLVDATRRGQVEDRARRRLGIGPRELTDADLDRVEELVDLGQRSPAEVLVGDLPEEQREAILARVVQERPYEEIAAQLAVSSSVVRQRVSRGLSTLRGQLDPEGGRP